MSQGMVAYRNRNTQTIHLFDAENPDLEARANFERVDLDQVPGATLDEARRERANREAIARAEETRAAGRGVEITVDTDGIAAGGTAEPAAGPLRGGHPDGVLSRPGADDVQIGPNPEQHPKTRAELLAQAALDAEVPQNVGVLVKQHLDGDPASAQVGDNARQTAERVAPTTGETVARAGRKPASRKPAGATDA